ncbi:unnamed protein product [Hymenolepis diminuta]|uniref:Ovule protein n=1 Tax=Hymenolepis diminuta TaxID=6216 RepID=A0A0R3SJV2_HYMDI|nr:unnamed protein product [Hymenolepis diminuta]
MDGRGTLERRKKTNSLSIFKRFSSRRDRKDLEANPVMKKKSISLEDMQSGVSIVWFTVEQVIFLMMNSVKVHSLKFSKKKDLRKSNIVALKMSAFSAPFQKCVF